MGWDLAHAVGNVQLSLHDWNVDFACWCTYKYLNSSPGGIGGIFIHTKHMDQASTKALTGWWSNKAETRFDMNFDLDPEKGAAAFVVSNPPPLLLCVNYANLEVNTHLSNYQSSHIALICHGSTIPGAYLGF